MKKLLSVALLLSIILTGCKKEEEIKYTDYSPYSKIVNEYELEYGQMEKVTSELSGRYDAIGFAYANLIDLDNNGVLELIVIKGEETHEVEIYTLIDNEIEFQESFLLHEVYAISSNENNEKYIILSTEVGGKIEIYRFNTESLEGLATLNEYPVTLGQVGTYEIDGYEVSEDEYNEKLNSYGAPENYIKFKLVGITNEEYDELLNIMHKTKTTLSDYPY